MYKETEPPCFGCTKRHAGCHAKCSGYLDWNEERQKMLEENRKAQDIERKLDDAEIQRHLKISNHRHHKKNKRSFGK